MIETGSLAQRVARLCVWGETLPSPSNNHAI